MTNHRKAYEKYYNIKIPKGYEIHHMDLNHDNNSIDNLVMLPKELHQMYHRFIYDTMCKVEGTKMTFDIKIHGNEIGYNLENLVRVKCLIDVIDECNKWHDAQRGIYVSSVNKWEGLKNGNITINSNK